MAWARSVPRSLTACGTAGPMTSPIRSGTKVGVVKDEHGHEICRDYGLGGGVHGLTIMRDDPDDPNTFDLLLIFTGGVGYDKGQAG